MPAIDAKLLGVLHDRAGCARWGVSRQRFAAALEASAARASVEDLTRYLQGLHLEDLAIACACADGNDAAWEHFILTHRPGLYRAAEAIAPGGGARDLADALYGDLFGTRERDGERQSLFKYFHGRSSLGTWLRAVLSQRYVDRIRGGRRLDPLPEDDALQPVVATDPDPDRARYLVLIRAALAFAISLLNDRDRLRLGLYYAQQLTLAQAGRILKESEATASRQLARTRKDLRRSMEDHLKREGRLADAEIARCFESVSEDAGPLDLAALLETAEPRKNARQDRSNYEP
jgi:RNA polymerase sigma factor (sigma-70 family)